MNLKIKNIVAALAINMNTPGGLCRLGLNTKYNVVNKIGLDIMNIGFEVLEKLNTPELIRERGIYLSYWTDHSTRYLPRRIPTKEEAELDRQLEMSLVEFMNAVSA